MICENIIGISKNGCGCNGVISSISKSGYYIDDTSKGRIPLNKIFYDCADPNINILLSRVCEDASKEVIEEINRRMEVSKKSVYFEMPIKKDYSGTMPAANFYAFTIRAKEANQKIFIGDIKYLPFSGSYTGVIEVYQNGVKIDENPKGKTYKIDADLHFVVPSTAGQPRDFKTRCCGLSYPCDHFIEFGGGGFNTTNDLSFKSTNYAFGFEVKATLDCDAWGFLCNSDFLNNPYANTLAKTIQLVARRNILEYIISSGKVTTYLTVIDDQIDHLREFLELEIKQRLDFLAMKYNFTNCKVCNTFFGSIMI